MGNIFIIAQHRTGSTLLKNMLDAHPNIVMAFDEMNVFEPGRSNSLDKLVGNSINTPKELLKAVESKAIYGTFWKEFEKSGISKSQLLSSLDEKPFNIKSILSTVLELLPNRDKEIKYTGVKYPVHLVHTNQLKKWFPQSKIIFLTRNPKAIIASKLNDPATKRRKQKSVFHRILIHYVTLLYFALEYNKSAKVWSQYKMDCCKIIYEDLVLYPQETLEAVCHFCGLSFSESMLNVNGKQSSYQKSIEEKPSRDSVFKYKEVLSSIDQWLIGAITNKSFKKLNS